MTAPSSYRLAPPREVKSVSHIKKKKKLKIMSVLVIFFKKSALTSPLKYLLSPWVLLQRGGLTAICWPPLSFPRDIWMPFDPSHLAPWAHSPPHPNPNFHPEPSLLACLPVAEVVSASQIQTTTLQHLHIHPHQTHFQPQDSMLHRAG